MTTTKKVIDWEETFTVDKKAVKFNQIMVRQCPLVSWYVCLD